MTFGKSAIHACRLSPLSSHLFLGRVDFQQVELTQSSLQLLSAALHLLLQLDVEDPQLLVLFLDLCLVTAQLLDSGLQLRRDKNKPVDDSARGNPQE